MYHRPALVFRPQDGGNDRIRSYSAAEVGEIDVGEDEKVVVMNGRGGSRYWIHNLINKLFFRSRKEYPEIEINGFSWIEGKT